LAPNALDLEIGRSRAIAVARGPKQMLALSTHIGFNLAIKRASVK
jgi:hypothetical protein